MAQMPSQFALARLTINRQVQLAARAARLAATAFEVTNEAVEYAIQLAEGCRTVSSAGDAENRAEDAFNARRNDHSPHDKVCEIACDAAACRAAEMENRTAGATVEPAQRVTEKAYAAISKAVEASPALLDEILNEPAA